MPSRGANRRHDETYSGVPLLSALRAHRLQHYRRHFIDNYRPALWAGTAVALHIGVGALVWRYLLGITASDAVFFSIVTFLTIGYGDITPHTPAGKEYFILYTILSLVVQLSVVGTLVSSALAEQDAEKACIQAEATFNTSAPRRVCSPNMYLKIRPRLLRIGKAGASLAGIVAVGAVLLHQLEGRDWLDAFYWTFVTLSTVGFGDIVPAGHRGLFAAYLLVGVLVFTYLLGEAIALAQDIVKFRRLASFFQTGLTEELLDRMDLYTDGQVAKYEFMMFVFQELDLVNKQQMDRALNMFAALDINEDGVLNVDDIRRRGIDVLPAPEEGGGSRCKPGEHGVLPRDVQGGGC